MTTPLNDDISPLLFHNNKESSSSIDILPSCLPYIGPIEVVDKRQSVCHGRGLITTRDVSAGECLFVIPPIFTVTVNEVHARYLLHQQSNSNGEGGNSDPAKVLERIAENQLVQQVQAAIAVLMDEEIIQSKQTIINRVRKQLYAFLLQMSSDNKVPTTTPNSDELMETLIGNAKNNYSTSKSISVNDVNELDEKTILHIIRRNAFGPDFHNYDRIANCWSTMSTDNVKNNSNSIYYNRLLGAYPLAAMINHSCCPNSVKVFGRIPNITTSLNGDNNSSNATSTDREVMIVHANTNIPKGTEITWSYLPPSTPYSIRHEALMTKYGFTCQCHRCIKEEMVYTNQPKFSTMLSTLTQKIATQSPEDTKAIESVVLNLEAYFVTPSTTTSTSPSIIPNETQRFLRAGYSQYYINYINTLLQQQQQQNQSLLDNNNNDVAKKKEGKFDIDHLVQIVTNLHFAFVTSNNASTEHISILHVCYDLAVHLRTLAINTSTRDGSNNNNNDNSNSNNNEVVKCTKRVHFWTDQLKRVHMIRYGKLGEDIENVRNVMKHTKLVLRNRDGWYMTRHCFI
jgi:hypothetical protein